MPNREAEQLAGSGWGGGGSPIAKEMGEEA